MLQMKAGASRLFFCGGLVDHQFASQGRRSRYATAALRQPKRSKRIRRFFNVDSTFIQRALIAQIAE
jgi:hypothetical protein